MNSYLKRLRPFFLLLGDPREKQKEASVERSMSLRSTHQSSVHIYSPHMSPRQVLETTLLDTSLVATLLDRTLQTAPTQRHTPTLGTNLSGDSGIKHLVDTRVLIPMNHCPCLTIHADVVTSQNNNRARQ